MNIPNEYLSKTEDIADQVCFYCRKFNSNKKGEKLHEKKCNFGRVEFFFDRNVNVIFLIYVLF